MCSIALQQITAIFVGIIPCSVAACDASAYARIVYADGPEQPCALPSLVSFHDNVYDANLSSVHSCLPRA